MVTRLLMLALCLLGAPVVLAPTAAQGVVQPCTVSYTRTGGTLAPVSNNSGFNAFGFDITDTRVVTDIDITVDVSHPEVDKFIISQLSPQTQGYSPAIFYMSDGDADVSTGSMNGVYTFDEESGAPKIAGANPAPGTYSPATAESALEGHPAVGHWETWLLNRSSQEGQLRSVTLTLSFATCDTDGDGFNDDADSCPTVINADQANRDSDALGDACDLDMDGDGLGNDADGCPLVATTTKTGCPAATRTATLTYVKKKHRLAVVVRSEVPGCRADAKVTLRRKKPGRDTRLLVSTTSSQGRYRLKAPRDGGRYYVTVAKSYATGQAECGTARSKVARVPRRR